MCNVEGVRCKNAKKFAYSKKLLYLCRRKGGRPFPCSGFPAEREHLVFAANFRTHAYKGNKNNTIT